MVNKTKTASAFVASPTMHLCIVLGATKTVCVGGWYALLAGGPP